MLTTGSNVQTLFRAHRNKLCEIFVPKSSDSFI